MQTMPPHIHGSESTAQGGVGYRMRREQEVDDALQKTRAEAGYPPLREEEVVKEFRTLEPPSVTAAPLYGGEHPMQTRPSETLPEFAYNLDDAGSRR